MKSIIQFILLCFVSFNLTAQSFDLIGVIDDQLVKINSNTVEIEVVGNLKPSPPKLVRFLTYSEEDCLFYGIMDPSYDPDLVTIDLDLNFVVIGRLSLPGNILYFCEGLSYNAVDEKLYAAVSIDGSIASNDYFSETLVEVNRSNANCTFKSELVGNEEEPDIDRMTFFDNTLYFHDGQPSDNWSRFYELDFATLGGTSQVANKTSVGYIPTKDLEYQNGNVYFSTGRDLSYYSISNYNFTDLGPLFSTSDFGGQEITGLCINPFPDYLNLDEMILICDEEEYLLELDYPYDNVTWNNGWSGNSILISESGLYWADVYYNGCIHRTDTVEVEIVINLDFDFGSDTLLCEGESLILTFPYPNIWNQWNNGTWGDELEITESGTYWMEYAIGNCLFRTDDIYVYFVSQEYNLNIDTSICQGEVYPLFLEGAFGDVIWNNGETGPLIIFSEPGLYWADIIYDDCIVRTDTIQINAIEALDFNINSDTVLCPGTSITYAVNDPNISVLWSDGTVGSEIIINETGTYWGEYMKEDCNFYSDTISVYVLENDFNIGQELTLCEGESYTVSLEGAGQNISWNTGYTGNNLVITEPGLYWGEVILNECEIRTDTLEVFYIDGLDFSLGKDTIICKGETVYFSINDPSINVLWSNGVVGNEILISETGQFFGQYVIDGCTFTSDTVDVLVVGDEFVLGLDQTICEGESISLLLEGAGQNVEWNNGFLGNPIDINEPGSYWAEINYLSCEILTDTIIVDVFPNQSLVLGADTLICGSKELILRVENPISEYLWSNGASGDSIKVTENGSYWVSTVNYECENHSDSIQISFIEDPEIEFSLDTILCEDDELVLSDAYYDIVWNNDLHENLSSITESGTYIGGYYIDNCYFETDPITVNHVDCTPCEYFIPNIFSPNFDDINDVFKVEFSESCNVLDFEMAIYDRWGSLVYESAINSWNGMIDSKLAINGVYVYTIKMTSLMYNGEEVESQLFGDVTIIK